MGMYLVVHKVEHLLNKRAVKLCQWPVRYKSSILFKSAPALQQTFENLPASLAIVNVPCPGVFLQYQTIKTS